MKKIIIVLALIGVVAILLLVDDPKKQQTAALTSIYDNIIQSDAKIAQSACQTFSTTLAQSKPGKRSNALDNDFKQLVMAWKAVQAIYIAGDLDLAAIDYPQRYIDTFHIGKGDLNKQMQRIINSDTAPKTALYTNQTKTINALEQVLYQSDDLNARKLELAKIISAHICTGLDKIAQTYTNHRDEFINTPDKALSLLTNALAGQTMYLKDWRIGDPAGLTKKYQGHPDSNRSEYPYSGLSLTAIQAILATQKQLIGEQPYANFRDLAAFYNADTQVAASLDLLEQAEQQINQLNNSSFDFNPAKAEALYNLAGELQISYYSNLLQALNVTAKILEADGD